MKLLQELDVKNKKVLLRTDFNVVVDDGKVKDGFRIKAVLPTIEYLQKQNAKILIFFTFFHILELRTTNEAILRKVRSATVRNWELRSYINCS